MKTPLRNIHVINSRSSRREEALTNSQRSPLPRKREITNSPLREFDARPGSIRELPNEIEAIILSRKAWKDVGRNGITIDGVEYYHPHSVTIQTKSGAKPPVQVLVVHNIHDPSVIHVLTDDGAYVESLPRKGLADHFDPVSTSRELSAVRAEQEQLHRRMEQLHGKDALETLQRERENLVKMRRIVHTFDHNEEKSETRLPSNNTARQIARAEARMQKGLANRDRQSAHDAKVLKRHGAAAIRDLLSESEAEVRPQPSTESDTGADLLSLLAGNETEADVPQP